MMRDFSELPADVLSVIARKLTLSDFVWFGAVCVSWRSASLANPKHCKLLSLLPVLLLPSPSTDDEEEDKDHNQQTDDDDEEVDANIWQLRSDDDDDDEEDEYNEDQDQQIDEEEEDEDEEDNEDEDDDDEEEEDEDNEDYDDDDDDDEEEEEEDEDEEKQIDDDEDNEDEDKQTNDDDDEDNKDKDKQTDEDEDTEKKNKTNTITRSLYSLYDGEVHDVQLRVGGNCRSSSHGWLVVTTEADQNFSVRLLNPFKSVNNEIELPPLTTFQLSSYGGGKGAMYSNYLIKAVISASPSSCSNPKDIVVMAIHGCSTLSFCRPGDKAWIALPHKWGRVFEDIIYYNGFFYGIIQSGSLFAIEIDPLHAKLKVFKELISVPLNHAGRKYIVESSGELLQVWRKIDHSRLFKYKTVCVEIFKLDQTGSNSKWVKMKIKTLNGRMLFLGHNASISLLASDFPGCKPNCIYFTDDNDEVFLSKSSSLGPHDIGIYNLEDGSFEPHYRMLTKDITPNPIWIQPTL